MSSGSSGNSKHDSAQIAETLTRSTIASAHHDLLKATTAEARQRVAHLNGGRPRSGKWCAHHDEYLDLYRSVKDAKAAGEYYGLPASVFERSQRATPEEKFRDPSARDHSRDFWQVLRDNVQKGQRITRQAGLATRLATELWDAERRGWTSVMATFTVRPEDYEKFCESSTLWSRHVRRIRRAIEVATHRRRIECHGCCSSVAAVAERGSRRGRLHIHALISADSWPRETSRDPKERRPLWRELNPPVQWPHGYEQWLPCRYHEADNWKRHYGHGWPCSRDKTGRLIPDPTGGPERIGHYVSKYLAKDDKRDLRWRTRMTTGYGTTLLRNLLATNSRLRKSISRSLSSSANVLGLPKSLIGRELALSLQHALPQEDIEQIGWQMRRSYSLWDVAKMAEAETSISQLGRCDTPEGSRIEEAATMQAATMMAQHRHELLAIIQEDDPGYAHFLRQR